MSTSRPGRAFRATRGLAYLGGFAVGGVGLSALYALTGVGLPCPFRMVTGWECPLCGGTRLGTALLHGDVVAAFSYNPVVLVGLVVLAVLGVLWTVEALGGPAARLPARLSVPLAQVRPTQWLIVGLAAAALFVVLRNLL
ncbi:hypothetical protein GCM10009616_09230 [Microlunatus lacustris]